MATSFKNGLSLHRLIETAPLDALFSFLDHVDEQQYAAIFSALPRDTMVDEAAAADVRKQLLSIANELQQDASAPLDRHARRVLTLAEGRGEEAITQVATKLIDQEDTNSFSAQLNAVGRSLWLYQNQPVLFDEAECLFYADHYRNFGRMYEAFEIDAKIEIALVWDEAVKLALETKIQEKLELIGRCTITHLEMAKQGEDKKEHLQHLLIVRHGGPLSSVACFEEADGSRGERYYRPLNEATLLYSPHDGVLEVFSASPSVRQQVAACFAETGLKIDLSDRPLTLKQYNFSRFLTSLSLSTPSIPGFDIERVAVVEVEARPDNPRHRAGLKVTIHDDIEEVAAALFGADHLFKWAASLARVVIAVRYTQDGTDRAKTLNITLSEPNRCNLRSNGDPVQRDLGYELLKSWKILQQVKPLTPAQEHVLFPALLQLFDQTKKDVAGQFFLSRHIDPEALLEAGFIERRGRFTSLLIDEGGTTHEVGVKYAGSGKIYYIHPVDALKVELPMAAAEKYAIRRDWLDETVGKLLNKHLIDVESVKLDEQLSYLGRIQLGTDTVPCYLARDLRTPQTLQRLDIRLRGLSDKGIGLVLSAGRDNPLCLGPNVIAAIADYISDDGDLKLLDMNKIASAYEHGKQLARGGMVVDLVKNGSYSATLYIPGKPALNLSGTKKIGFFQALVDAFRSGSPAVPSKKLMEAAGANSASPRQLLGNELWDSIEGVYVGFPPGVKRNSYQLLV